MSISTHEGSVNAFERFNVSLGSLKLFLLACDRCINMSVPCGTSSEWQNQVANPRYLLSQEARILLDTEIRKQGQ
jgi:hypothetical protein